MLPMMLTFRFVCCSLHNQGPTLRELADILVEYQAEYAVNMDGGSSSELVQGGTVLSRPTCLDLPFVCERPVASIFCIQTNEISSY
jgi:exopolysaccharide biosynthesis protein